MRITKQKLKQIILEELNKLKEMDVPFDDTKDYYDNTIDTTEPRYFGPEGDLIGSPKKILQRLSKALDNADFEKLTDEEVTFLLNFFYDLQERPPVGDYNYSRGNRPTGKWEKP